MAANGYEIRLTILQMAKEMAYENWNNTRNVAFHNSDKTNTPVAVIDPPSFAEIEDLAKQLYGFVGQRPATDAAADYVPYKNAAAKRATVNAADYLKKVQENGAESEWDEGHPNEGPLRNPSIP